MNSNMMQKIKNDSFVKENNYANTSYYRQTTLSISLEIIEVLHKISIRAKNVCNVARFESLDDIIAHYQVHQTFLNLKNAGAKTTKELETICDFYLNEKLFTLSIKTLCEKKMLTDYELKVLKEENVETIKEFIEKRPDDLMVLDKPLMKWYYKYFFQKKMAINYLQTKEEYFSLNKEHLLALISREKKKLTSVSDKVLESIIKDISSNPVNIYEYLSEEKLRLLKNTRNKSVKELKSFFKSIVDTLNSDKSKKINELDIKIIVIETELDFNDNELRNWLDEKSFSINEELPFFTFLEFYLKHVVEERLLDIMKKYFAKQNTSCEDKRHKNILGILAKKYSITKERARQLKGNSIAQILVKAKYLITICKRHKLKLPNYIDGSDYENIILSTENISNNEDCSLPSIIIFPILESLYNNHALVIKNKKKQVFKYLLPIKVLDQVKLKELIGHLGGLLEQKVEVAFKLHLKGLIYQFANKDIDILDLEYLMRIVENVIYAEFGLLTNLDGELVIKRTTSKKTYEYLVDILEEKGEPIHVNQMALLINQYLPNKPKKVETIRSHFLRFPEVFVNTALSTYGLKKWEKEGKIKGGAIIELIIDYLSESENPKHVYYIAKYITQFRDTNERSIDGLIRSDVLNRFVSYKCGFHGLVGKHSPHFESQINRLPGNFLRGFIKRHFFQKMKKSINIIILQEAKFHNTIPAHIMVYVYKKIEEGYFKLENNYLELIK